MTDAHPGAVAGVENTGHAPGDDLEWLLSRGRRRSAARVLDLATGGGRVARAFASFTPSVIATDASEAMLRGARTSIAGNGEAAVRFLAADVETLPFRDASFGVVTCRIAAHHFPELLPALRQVGRVLRPGGAFLVEDILGCDDPDLAGFMVEVERRCDPSHVRSFRQIEWTAFLRAVGLTVIDEAILSRVRDWDEWTARTRIMSEARRDLDRFVLDAPARYREALQFELDGDRIVSFTERMLLLRADKD